MNNIISCSVIGLSNIDKNCLNIIYLGNYQRIVILLLYNIIRIFNTN